MTCDEKLTDIQSKVIAIKAKTDLMPNTIATDISTLKTDISNIKDELLVTNFILKDFYKQILGKEMI